MISNQCIIRYVFTGRRDSCSPLIRYFLLWEEEEVEEKTDILSCKQELEILFRVVQIIFVLVKFGHLAQSIGSKILPLYRSTCILFVGLPVLAVYP